VAASAMIVVVAVAAAVGATASEFLHR
jgi:hypothetical protein